MFSFIRNLKEKSHELISNFIKKDHTGKTCEVKPEVAEATGASSTEYYGVGLPEDKIYEDTHSDIEDKT